MHRSYRPIQPAQNKLLARRWDDRYYEDHRRKVIEARPTVDSRPPQTYMHLHLKLKKLQLEEDRLYTIERDNRILLGKMSNIMRAKGGVDNRNSYEYKSLNRDKRVRDLIRVGNENQQILRRITTKKPQYDHTEWEKDWETNRTYMDQISAYPKDWWRKADDYADDTPRSSRRGGGATNRSSRTYDSRDSSPGSDKRRRRKNREEDEEEDEDRSNSEDEEDRKKEKRREEKKKGKKREEEEEERERQRSKDRKRADEKLAKKYIDAGKEELKVRMK